jgi:hypothetical protein
MQEKSQQMAGLVCLAVAIGCLSGCQSLSKPWAGVPYESPHGREVTHAPSTYSPTPTIQPSRVAQTIDTASQDAAIERFLYQQKNVKQK